MNKAEILRRENLLLMGNHFQQVVRMGHPTVGWEGDPWLSVYYNKLLDRFEIWDEQIPDKPRLEIRSRPLEGRPLDPIELASMLVESDLRRKDMRQRVDEIERYNEAIERELRRKEAEKKAEAWDRVRFGLMKDIGHLY